MACCMSRPIVQLKTSTNPMAVTVRTSNVDSIVHQTQPTGRKTSAQQGENAVTSALIKHLQAVALYQKNLHWVSPARRKPVLRGHLYGTLPVPILPAADTPVFK